VARVPKCKLCEKEVDKETAIKHSSRYYHPECHKHFEQQKQDRKDLIDYICKLHRIEAPTGMMLKQIKEYQEEFNYKYKGMELALRYFYETLENRLREGDGIGIIPFVYEDAKKHYLKRRNVEKSAQNMQLEPNKRIIHIKSPKLEIQQKVKPIDMASL
jgi:hypothetical protein